MTVIIPLYQNVEGGYILSLLIKWRCPFFCCISHSTYSLLTFELNECTMYSLPDHCSFKFHGKPWQQKHLNENSMLICSVYCQGFITLRTTSKQDVIQMFPKHSLLIVGLQPCTSTLRLPSWPTLSVCLIRHDILPTLVWFPIFVCPWKNKKACD